MRPQPALAAPPSGPATEQFEPHRFAVRYGERVAWDHDGPMCWNMRQNAKGRWVAVIRMGEREYRGAPCRGQRTAVVRLPWGIVEDEIRVWARDGYVFIFTIRHD